MQRRVSTYVYADDPILQAGVISQLRMRAEIDVVESGDLERGRRRHRGRRHTRRRNDPDSAITQESRGRLHDPGHERDRRQRRG